MGSGLPIDILLFAMIAVYLVFRLRNVLGRRDGHESGYRDLFERGDKDQGDAESTVEDDRWSDDDETVVQLSDMSKETPLDSGVRAIRALDRDFDPDTFLEGACVAFEMILNAYSSGDTETLKSLLSDEVYGNFNQAIKDREQAGETLEDTLVGINETVMQEAYVEGRTAFVTIKFVTEQVNVTRDENDDVVDGDPNTAITVTDFWTFSRDTRSSDPNWALVATQSAD